MKVRNVRRILCSAIMLLSVWAVFTAPTEAAGGGRVGPGCQTVRACRVAAHYNRSIVIRDQARFRVARRQSVVKVRYPAAETTCHTVKVCRQRVAVVVKLKNQQEKAWHVVLTSNTVYSAHLVVNWVFASCGPVAQTEATDIVGWESDWIRTNINGAGDTGWWQFELPAHPDISVRNAEDILWSSQRAKRDSKCGRDWSPEWSSVRDHGRDWD